MRKVNLLFLLEQSEWLDLSHSVSDPCERFPLLRPLLAFHHNEWVSRNDLQAPDPMD